jgi:hypothetical protein
MLDSDDMYDFDIRPKPAYLQKVALAVNFAKCFPNTAGFRWVQNHLPVYYKKGFQSEFKSKLVANKLLPFMTRIIKEDLYKNNSWLQGSEATSSNKNVFSGNYLPKMPRSNVEWETFPIEIDSDSDSNDDL